MGRSTSSSSLFRLRPAGPRPTQPRKRRAVMTAGACPAAGDAPVDRSAAPAIVAAAPFRNRRRREIPVSPPLINRPPRWTLSHRAAEGFDLCHEILDAPDQGVRTGCQQLGAGTIAPLDADGERSMGEARTHII